MRKLSSLVASESQVQASVVEFLRLHRMTVLETSKRGQQRPGGGWSTLATPGVPDLLVRHPLWPRGAALMMEVKRPGGRMSPEQTALWESGSTCRVESVEAASQAVYDMFFGLGIPFSCPFAVMEQAIKATEKEKGLLWGMPSR